MSFRSILWPWLIFVAVLSVLSLTAAPLLAQDQAKRFPPSKEESEAIQAKTEQLAEAIKKLEADGSASSRDRNQLADLRLFVEASRRIVREGEFFRKDSVDQTIQALDRGLERIQAASEGRRPWTEAKGGTVRGYVSAVDGSVQPYAIYLPESYDGQTAMRLDVILHGRNATLTEVGFIQSHDGKAYPEGENGLVLHVFGRGNNAYRWSGEADVFEAIHAVSANYRVDPSRILLRGFSMGGAGAWHLGLHHPREWCAVEAGAGFTESKKYARLKDLPDYQEKALRIYDAVDYALNAFNLPIAGYGGEEDSQLQASVNILEALESLGFPMERDGLVTRGQSIDFLQVVGAKTGHKVDPASEEILEAFRDKHAERGQPPSQRDRIRFVTYTLAFSQGPGITIEALEEHYQRAEIEAEVVEDQLRVKRAENVTALAIDRELAETVVLDGQVFPLRRAAGGLLPNAYYRKEESGWTLLDYDASRALQLNSHRVKRPGLQGPIDHAFMGPFLCVRGTGKPWNANVQAWSQARLERFAEDWRRFLHGEIRIKDDVDVTPEDLAKYHLILFGDPGSNLWISRAMPGLPLNWSKSEVAIGEGPSYPATDHAPALIVANPLNPLRYLVINSGHTFGAEAFQGTNALLYPRLGDHAMLRVRNRGEEVIESGYFDEAWQPRTSENEDASREGAEDSEEKDREEE